MLVSSPISCTHHNRKYLLSIQIQPSEYGRLGTGQDYALLWPAILTRTPPQKTENYTWHNSSLLSTSEFTITKCCLVTEFKSASQMSPSSWKSHNTSLWQGKIAVHTQRKRGIKMWWLNQGHTGTVKAWANVSSSHLPIAIRLYFLSGVALSTIDFNFWGLCWMEMSAKVICNVPLCNFSLILPKNPNFSKH